MTAAADAETRCPCGHGDCRGLEEGDSAAAAAEPISSKRTSVEWKWNGALLGSLLIAGALAFSACSSHRGAVVYVPNGPPVAISEPVGHSPGPGYVWIPGYHVWRGNAYAWVYGHWELAPRSRARWAPGHWSRNRNGWYWVEGRWRY
jgi:hypothetical protein